MHKRLKTLYVASPLLLCFLLTLIASILIPVDCFAYDRKVLFEDFTSTTCPPCASSAAAIEAGLEDVGDEGVASIAYHMGWPAPGNDPWYLANTDDNYGRRQYYGVNAIPMFFIDGTLYQGQRSAAAVANAIRNRQRVESPCMIEISANLVDETVTAEVSVTADENLNNVYLYVALVEAYYRYRAPTGQNDHYDAMLKMLSDYRGTRFSLDANSAEEFNFELNIDDLGWHELEPTNLIMIAWVQDDNHTVQQSQNFYMYSEVSYAGWEISDADGGDNDGRIEAGETGRLIISLANAPARKTAVDITITVTSDDDDLVIEQNSVVIERIAGGEVADNSDNPILVRVREGAEAHPVTLSLSIRSENGEVDIEEDIDIMLGWPPVLVVDVSENQAAAEAMMEPFGEGDLPYADRFSRADEGLISVGLLENYSMVIWHSFNIRNEVINGFEEELIQEYLDNGGNFVLSSPGYVREMGDGNFMRRYLGAEVDEMDIGQNEIYGVEGDPHFSGMRIYAGGRAGGAGYPDFSPTLLELGDARVVMNWQDRNGNVFGVTGVSNETDNYRTLVLAFPIETISGFLNSDERVEFMERLWYWHSSPGSAPFDGELNPVSFSLDAAYPNPFNSSTVIPFTIDNSGFVKLSLFNLNGKEVSRLFEGERQRGFHKFNLNAEQAGISSGLYYLKLEASGKSSQQKILYIR